MQSSRATATATAKPLPALYFMKLKDGSSGFLVRHENVWLFFLRAEEDKKSPRRTDEPRSFVYYPTYLYKPVARVVKRTITVMKEHDTPEFVQLPSTGDQVDIVHTALPRTIMTNAPHVIDILVMPPIDELRHRMLFPDHAPIEFVRCITSAVDAWRALVAAAPSRASSGRNASVGGRSTTATGTPRARTAPSKDSKRSSGKSFRHPRKRDDTHPPGHASAS